MCRRNNSVPPLTFARFGPVILGLMFALLTVTLAVAVWGIVWMTRQDREDAPNRYRPELS